MAGDWIKMEATTPDKPEVLAIAARMGWSDPDYAVGKLFRVWRWFDQQTIDGNAKDVTPALLDCLIGTQGFAEAMASVGWLTIRSDGIQLPGFDKHCGNTAKNRAETAKRVASHRAKKGDAAPQPVERSILPRPIRAQILKRDGHSCVYCGRAEGEYTPPEVSTAGVLHIDHVIPLSQGGSDDPQNLVTACSVCNMFKGDRTPEECGLEWPVIEGKKAGNRKSVTEALPREEKRREEEKNKLMSGKPDPEPRADHSDAVEILGYLNARAGKAFRPVKSNVGLVLARLREGASVDDCKAVIDAKVAQWLGDAKMSEFLRPATLFGREKFAQYLGHVGSKQSPSAQWWLKHGHGTRDAAIAAGVREPVAPARISEPA